MNFSGSQLNLEIKMYGYEEIRNTHTENETIFGSKFKGASAKSAKWIYKNVSKIGINLPQKHINLSRQLMKTLIKFYNNFK